jgi:hypothetical protein
MSPDSEFVNRYLLVCNGASKSGIGKWAAEWRSVDPQLLWTYTPRANVQLKITDITNYMAKRLAPVVEDLVELSALVYAADQACRRVYGNTFEYGKRWNRTFRFEMAVRDENFWNRPDVIETLRDTLSFLSDDNYEFSFTQNVDPPKFAQYLEFKTGKSWPEAPERVMLFSGGLDSLAGAAEEVFVHERRVALVSHRPVDHLAAKQRDLVDEIRRRARQLRPGLGPLHFAVKANKAGALTVDNTQRSRSFLYAAMAAAVADLFKLDGIYFYENGVVSVNLPLCGQEVGGRATRTTHPQVLHGLARLFTLVFGREFTVRNEYLWDTKEDVLRRLLRTNHADLARQSFSCIHTRRLTLSKPHCGLCSQCLSRWIASLGAEYGDDDPASGYDMDVLTGPRRADPERILAERFIGWSRRVAQMRSVDEFNLAFAGELARVSPFVGLSERDAVGKLFDLHLQHAEQVARAIEAPMLEHVKDLYAYELPDTSVLAYAFDRRKYADPTGAGGNRNPAAGNHVLSIILSGEDEAPVVLNKAKPLLNPAPYRVVKALIEANAEGKRLTCSELDKRAGCIDARKHLAQLRKNDPDWAAVLLMPKGKGRGYGIR